jgi:hypothetical protein
MAFYHSTGCDCPVGCCDCGPTDPYEDAKALVRKFMMELVPRDAFMILSTGDLTEGYRRYPKREAPNLRWIGQIDDAVTVKNAIAKLEQLESFMICCAIELPREAQRDLLHDLARWLADASSPGVRPALAEIINDKYAIKFQRVVTDWHPVF